MQVEVNGSLEGAIRELKKKVQHDGVHRELRQRLDCVTKSERRKRKMILSLQRKKRSEKKQEARALEWRRRRYDHDYEVKRFERQYGIGRPVS